MSPSTLSPERRRLYDDMRNGIEAGFKGFIAIEKDGRLMGSWNPWLHFPKFGGPVMGTGQITFYCIEIAATGP